MKYLFYTNVDFFRFRRYLFESHRTVKIIIFYIMYDLYFVERSKANS